MALAHRQFFLSAIAGILALATGLFISAATLAQSFDCKQAKRPDEKAICNDTGLSARDEVVSMAFEEAKKVTGRKTVLAATRKLLSDRHRCGSDVECITRNQDASLQVYQALGSTLTWDFLTGSEGQAGIDRDDDGEADPGTTTYIDLDVPVPNETLRIDNETFLFNVCNKSPTDVTLAISGRSAPQSTDFLVAGWFLVKKGQCSDLGPFMKGDFFWTAAGPNEIWGKGVRLCVQPKAFKRIHSPGEREKCGKGYTLPFTHIFAQRDHEKLTLTK